MYGLYPFIVLMLLIEFYVFFNIGCLGLMQYLTFIVQALTNLGSVWFFTGIVMVMILDNWLLNELIAHIKFCNVKASSPTFYIQASSVL